MSTARNRSQRTVFGAVGFALALLAALIAGRKMSSSTARPYDSYMSVMKGLEISIRSYTTEYLRLPSDPPAAQTPMIESRGALLSILLAEDTARNPREIRFWDPPPYKERTRSGAMKTGSGEWELRDPMGNFYHLYLDLDGDGQITNPAKGSSKDEPEVISADVILHSAGPDGDYSTWKDNIKSWD